MLSIILYYVSKKDPLYLNLLVINLLFYFQGELEAELGVNEADAEIEKDRQERKHKKMPAFLKGQSHAVRRKRKRGLSSEKKQRSNGLSPFDHKAGPSSAKDFKEQLPDKIS